MDKFYPSATQPSDAVKASLDSDRIVDNIRLCVRRPGLYEKNEDGEQDSTTLRRHPLCRVHATDLIVLTQKAV